MTTINQKQEILQSLKSLDAVQSEKVLDFIRTLLYVEPDELQHQRVKRQAMKEIGQALKQKQNSF